MGSIYFGIQASILRNRSQKPVKSIINTWFEECAPPPLNYEEFHYSQLQRVVRTRRQKPESYLLVMVLIRAYLDHQSDLQLCISRFQSVCFAEHFPILLQDPRSSIFKSLYISFRNLQESLSKRYLTRFLLIEFVE